METLEAAFFATCFFATFLVVAILRFATFWTLTGCFFALGCFCIGMGEILSKKKSGNEIEWEDFIGSSRQDEGKHWGLMRSLERPG